MIKNDLMDWIETYVLFNLRTKIVANFLWKNIIYYFKYFESTIINEGFENKMITKKLLNRYSIRIKLILIYHTWINEMGKRKHWPLMNVLLKLTKDKVER